jgi:hypothetical protein
MSNCFSVFVAAGLLAAMACLAPAQEPPKTAPPAPQGMIELFNGRDLAGWDGDPEIWSVRDGAIRGETTSDKRARGNTFLILQGGNIADFDLRLSYRVSQVNNSGVQYRSRHLLDHRDNKWVVQGYQAEVRDDNVLTGFIYDEKGKRGRMCLPGERAIWTAEGKKSLGIIHDQETLRKSLNIGGWNDYVIICRGSNIRHYINGVQFMDFTDEHPGLALKEGIIALQIHGGAPMWVEFKNIRLKKFE